MLPQNENKLLDLCQQAMHEEDVHKLLRIFLALDRAANGSTLNQEPMTEIDCLS